MNTLMTPPVVEFNPKLPLFFESNGFAVKTADCAAELEASQRLRHSVFYEERGRRLASGLDRDEFDADADHLLILGPGARVIASYRLRSSTHARRFYSETEFDLARFLAAPGVKLELGRACVDPAFRDSAALGLLWKGLGRYAREAGVRYLFGCSTVWTPYPREALGVYRHLLEYSSREWDIHPLPEYRHSWYGLDEEPGEDFSALVPPLLRAYLRMGARLHSLPAYDRDFACTDLFTILDLGDMDPRRRARYFGEAA